MASRKPTIYLDTNIVSVLFYQGDSLEAVHQQMVTREWWATERKWFRVFGSDFTEGELSAGIYPGQKKSVSFVRRLPYLSYTATVRRFAQVFLDERLIPLTVPGDAIQLAFATVHGMDYLLTWNYAHLANPETQRRLAIINRRHGWRTPSILSPETIPQVALGQDIRRPSDENENS